MTFPQSGFSPNVSYEMHGKYLEYFGNYLQSLSQGKLQLSNDAEVLLPPGTTLDASNPVAATWQAELAVQDYEDFSTVPAGYSYAFLADWWSRDVGYASPLFAEIMYNIWQAYKDSPDELFPLDPADTQGWQLMFVFLTDPGIGLTPFVEGSDHNIGGRPNVHINRSALEDSTGGFYANLAGGRREFSGSIGGTGQIGMALDAPPSGVDSRAYVFPFIHEFMHTLGFGDGPPDIRSGSVEERYFYGNLNIMCQAFPHTNDQCIGVTPFKGYPPLFDPGLAFLSWNTGTTGDNSVVNFTTKTYRDEKVYSVGSGGQFFRYDLAPYDGQDQYFLLAYHSGNGLDDQGFSPGNPVVPGEGLAIWHCIGTDGGFSMVDLESAHGLYDYPATGLEEFVPSWNVPGIIADPDNGYDNYDPWVPTTQAAYRTDYCYYDGSEADFFQINSDPNLDKREFSYRTNPNTNGYDPADANPILRRRTQNVGAGLVVRVKGSGTDTFGDYMVVDLLNNPSEELVSVDLDTMSFVQGQSYNLALSSDFADVITSYDVLLSTNGGANYWYTLDEGVVFDPLDPTYSFTPQAEHATQSGKFLFRFHSATGVGEFESPGSFEVTGNVVVRGDITNPDGGELLFEGIPIYIEWYNFFDSDPGTYPTIRYVKVNYISTCSPDTVLVGYFSNPNVVDPPYDLWDPTAIPAGGPTGGAGFSRVPWTPPAGIACDSAAIHIEFYTAGAMASDVSDSSFAIYPAGFEFVAEDSLAHHVDYVGTATGTAVWDYSGDGMQDLFVAVGDSASRIYRNDSANGHLAFKDVTSPVFFDPTQLDAGATAVAVADVDNDGTKEIFVAHDTSPAFFAVGQDGLYHNVIGDPAYFLPEQVSRLAKSTCGSFVDFDHDGDLDLYVGRADGVIVPVVDSLFRNELSEKGSLGFSCTAFDSVETTGLFDEAPQPTLSVAWSDMDGDRLLEMALGRAYALNRVRLFAEDYDGHFVADGELVTIGSPSDRMRSLSWVDIDQDNDLDLFAGERFKSYVFTGANGSLGASPSDIIPAPSDMIVMASRTRDINLDGRPELVRVGTGGTNVEVFYNVGDNSSYSSNYLEVGQGVGAGAAASGISALAVSDFDRDGDPDFFFGRGTLAGRILRCLGPNRAEAPAHNWIRFRLAGDGEDNVGGVGASVSVSTLGGDPLGMQVLAANSSAAGQDDPLLTFGLGTHASPIVVTVSWPLGYEQQFQVAPETFNTTITLNQPVGFQLDLSSPAVEKIFDPVYGYVDYVFTWKTDRFTTLFNDVVNLTCTTPGGCNGTTFVLSGPPSVDPPTYKIDPGTGATYFIHTAHIRFHECLAPCSYAYTVTSQSGSPGGGPPQTSSTRKFSVKVCPSF